MTHIILERVTNLYYKITDIKLYVDLFSRRNRTSGRHQAPAGAGGAVPARRLGEGHPGKAGQPSSIRPEHFPEAPPAPGPRASRCSPEGL
jgi:hypothetical protein